jgi:hypothetical protein
MHVSPCITRPEMNRDFENSVYFSHYSADKPVVADIERRLETCELPFRYWFDRTGCRGCTGPANEILSVNRVRI